MLAYLTAEDDKPNRRDNESTFNRTGTYGRIALRNATKRKIINAAAWLQKQFQGRAIQVEEVIGNPYSKPTRVWVYHCACDLDSPCNFHADLY